MSLNQNGFDFTNTSSGDPWDTGTLFAETDFDLRLITSDFVGVKGEAVIADQPKGRVLACDVIFRDYPTRADLDTDLVNLASQAGQLNGTLTQVLPSDGDNPPSTFPNCVFLGVQWDPPGPFWDGSGQHGWCLFGRLRWRQTDRN
jgi:hypothetical protein